MFPFNTVVLLIFAGIKLIHSFKDILLQVMSNDSNNTKYYGGMGHLSKLMWIYKSTVITTMKYSKLGILQILMKPQYMLQQYIHKGISFSKRNILKFTRFSIRQFVLLFTNNYNIMC